MERIEPKTKNFKIGNTTKERATADEMYEAFGKKVSYPLIRKLINEYGVRYVFERYLQLRKEGKLSWKLLCWKCSHETKIIYDRTT